MSEFAEQRPLAACLLGGHPPFSPYRVLPIASAEGQQPAADLGGPGHRWIAISRSRRCSSAWGG